MIDRPLPKTGQWYIRKNRDNKSARLAEHPTDIVQIGEIDAAKEKIETRRFDGYDGSKPIFGRITSVSFETWHKEGRYTETHEPVPAMLDRDGALRMLRALGAFDDEIEDVLRDPRKALLNAEADPPPAGLEHLAASTMAILSAHVAYLDAQGHAVTPPDGMPVTALDGAKIVNLIDAPDASYYMHAAQPTIADVLASIEALRSEVRADRKPLLDAVDRVLGNHGPYGSESDAVEVHLDAFKALRDARAKV